MARSTTDINHPLAPIAAPVIAIMGPTASGKSQAAEAVCRVRPCEIVSVDSALVYRGMDIGTAKPSLQIRAEIPHHLIDILEPEESFSAAQFAAAALESIRDIHARGKVPLLVGGTMLYFRALFEGLAPLPTSSVAVRERLLAEADTLGLAALHQRLQRIDPLAAERIHPNDPQRILRALEVFEIAGKPLSQLWQEAENYLFPYPITRIVLSLSDRGKLHQRIEQRLDAMFAAGFVDEVARLRARSGLSPELPSMRSVGYRQVWEFLEGGSDYATMRQRALFATRQLAKRQLTWLRQLKNAQWIEADENDIAGVVLKIIDAVPS